MWGVCAGYSCFLCGWFKKKAAVLQKSFQMSTRANYSSSSKKKKKIDADTKLNKHLTYGYQLVSSEGRATARSSTIAQVDQWSRYSLSICLEEFVHGLL